MIEKEFKGQKGPLSHVKAKIDENLSKLNCIGMHRIFQASRCDFSTGILQLEFIFENPNDENCGHNEGYDVVYKDYIKALSENAYEACEILRDYVEEFISVAGIPVKKYTDVIKIDLETTHSESIQIPMFSDTPELGYLVVDLFNLVKGENLKYSGIICQNFSSDGIVRVFIKYLSSNDNLLVDGFLGIKENTNISSSIDDNKEKCFKTEKTTVGYFELLNNNGGKENE